MGDFAKASPFFLSNHESALAVIEESSLRSGMNPRRWSSPKRRRTFCVAHIEASSDMPNHAHPPLFLTSLRSVAMFAFNVDSSVLESNRSARRFMRSVSFLASSIHGVAASNICFRSSLRSSIDVRAEPSRSLSVHSRMAVAITGWSRSRPDAIEAENIDAAASLAVEAFCSSSPGRAVTTYHVGLSQNSSVTRASAGTLGSGMLKSLSSGAM